MPRNAKSSPVLVVFLAVVIILSGMGTGFALAQMRPVKGIGINGGNGPIAVPSDPNAIKVGQIYGDKDSNKHPDTAEGILVIGGMSGDGTHHLIRPGGASQYVYLTSSVLDLDKFAGDKVTVRGETFQAQKVGWLMDISQVTVEQLNAQPPDSVSPTPDTPADE